MKQMSMPTCVEEHVTCDSQRSFRVTIHYAAQGEECQVDNAIFRRNKAWTKCSLIPHWVNPETVGLDCYYTNPDIAQHCTDSLLQVMRQEFANIEKYWFVEPGAGTGVFYDLMPSERRIGIDILPQRNEFLAQDFLTWIPTSPAERYAVLGNPPFGYRAWLALAFLNHSARFADYMGLILPMGFQSDGKGSPKHRVRGAQLVHSEPLPPHSFVDGGGRPVKLNALWQVWKRGVNNVPPPKTCSNWIDLFTVDTRKQRLCGQERLDEADYFLQRTYFGEPPVLVTDFSEVKYACGYGIVLKNEAEAITRLLNETDWTQYSNLAMHNCRHISMYHIKQAVIDGGYVDG